MNPGRTTHIAFWWTVEMASMCVCGCALVPLVLDSPFTPLLILFVLWFAFAHMHEGLSLESLVIEEGAGGTYRPRRLLLLRLLFFYFTVLSVGLAFLLVSRSWGGRYGTVVPVTCIMGWAALRLVLIQRRYLRLRGEELSAEERYE